MSLIPISDIDFEFGEAILKEEDPYHPKPQWSGNGNGEIPREKYLVVIPSMRPINLDYFDAVRKLDIFIADDSDGKVDRTNLERAVIDNKFARFIVFDRERTEKYVSEKNLWLFPNHNPSVKNIGLYYAWKEGYEAVILLDDDCDTRELEEEDFLTIGKKITTWDTGFGGDWVNTLALITPPPIADRTNQKLFARGFPYEYRTYGFGTRINSLFATPYFNQGLWVGSPDINGIDKLELYPDQFRDMERQIRNPEEVEKELPWWIPLDTKVMPGQVLLRKEQKLPLSIMNCQISTSLIPAFFQPADFPIYNTYKIRRHDDIWSMYILKVIMDRLKLDATVGNPLVFHRKAGNVIGECLSEHYTNLIQSSLTNLIDEAVEAGFGKGYRQTFDARSVSSLTRDLMTRVRGFGSSNLYARGEYGVVLDNYFKQAQGWTRLFVV
jgi:hypothetical protein